MASHHEHGIKGCRGCFFNFWMIFFYCEIKTTHTQKHILDECLKCCNFYLIKYWLSFQMLYNYDSQRQGNSQIRPRKMRKKKKKKKMKGEKIKNTWPNILYWKTKKKQPNRAVFFVQLCFILKQRSFGWV